MPYNGSVRTETNHVSVPIRPMTQFIAFAKRFMTDDEIEVAEKYVDVIQPHTSNRWSFDPKIAELRFGPNVIAIETPVTNVRFTSSWNSEAEAHLIHAKNLSVRTEQTTAGVRLQFVPSIRQD